MSDKKWTQPTNPPPPLFTGEKERNLVKQINDEVIERVIGQTVLYYPISLDKTNFHSLYGKGKNLQTLLWELTRDQVSTFIFTKEGWQKTKTFM